MQAKQGASSFDWHQQLLIELLKSPTVKTRRGLAFTSVGHLLKFDLTKEFPVTKAKKLFFDTVARELFCFLKGRTDKKFLHEHGVHIWDANFESGKTDNLGKVYGAAWRVWIDYSLWQPVDQLQTAVNILKENSSSRKAIVTSWDPAMNYESGFAPCHVMFQFNIVDDVLHCDVFQRSSDVFLGLPFDVASYAILTRLVNNELGQYKEQLNYHITNLHLYKAHRDAATLEIVTDQVECSPLLYCEGKGINNFDYNKCKLGGYPETIKSIKAKLLV
jgi:thymidylate synthase